MMQVVEARMRSPSLQSQDVGSQEGDISQSAQLKAPKDRQCPFCHVPFTSSSLGRHLDLYIKPRNPKPPDGIHDARKIREMRGKITRRQPRNSLRKHDSELHQDQSQGDEVGEGADGSPGQAQPTVFRPITVDTFDSVSVRKPTNHERDTDMLSPATFTGNQNALRRDEKVKTAFGTANWQGTGVIVGLPAFNADMQRFDRPERNTYSPSSAAPPQGIGAAQLPNGAPPAVDEHERAAQLALHHVLESLSAARATLASTTTPTRTLFDFDLHGQTFASLVLRILPAPLSLFALHPYDVPDSWPLSPPEQAHLTSIREIISSKAASINLDGNSSEVVSAHKNVDLAYGAWNRMSGQEKQRCWELEMMRGLARARKKNEEMTAEVKVARQRAEYFRRQHEKVLMVLDGRAGGDMAGVGVGAEEPLDLEESVMGELERKLPEARSWNYEGLVEKWRRRARQTERPRPDQVAGTQERARIDPALQANGTPGATSSAGQTPASGHHDRVGSPRVAPPLRLTDNERDIRWLWDDGRRRVEAPDSAQEIARKTLFDYQPKRKVNGTSKEQDAEEPRPGGEWMDAASQAVSRVMAGRATADNMDVDQTAGAQVNGNGKRARPPSWTDTDGGGVELR